MKPSHPLHEPSLIDVHLAFENWRSVRAKRQHTPKHLRLMAADLLQQHRPSTICQALGLNDSTLKRWAKQEPEPVVKANAFVVLPEPLVVSVARPTPQNRCLSINLPKGVQLDLTQGFSLREALAANSELRLSR